MRIVQIVDSDGLHTSQNFEVREFKNLGEISN